MKVRRVYSYDKLPSRTRKHRSFILASSLIAMFKPFTPLTLNRKKTSDSTDGEEDKSGPEAKRQRLDYNGSSVSTSIGPPNGIKRLASQPGIRKPLLTVNNSTPSETSKGPAPIIPKPSLDTGGRYNVLWRKYTTKKYGVKRSPDLALVNAL